MLAGSLGMGTFPDECCLAARCSLRLLLFAGLFPISFLLSLLVRFLHGSLNTARPGTCLPFLGLHPIPRKYPSAR
ncbi:hypothetical protein DUNSADRAFT_16467 [Dunaliella salina]|uniref:Encoded protein n=1 Tax=Dunaliella salina TaxID=3046 RepID=A0ABQ7H110_DUNSA|nr:hypothetical protein DUNSADRAFT_16467 [Dunaliella salina]|eukprot:KAF5840526.1 hypothetical protein DUNSADRAFT_16467 [Dunaliella salina]